MDRQSRYSRAPRRGRPRAACGAARLRVGMDCTVVAAVVADVEADVVAGSRPSRPAYCAIGVTAEGTGDPHASGWAPVGGREVLAAGAQRDQEPRHRQPLHRRLRPPSKDSASRSKRPWPLAGRADLRGVPHSQRFRLASRSAATGVGADVNASVCTGRRSTITEPTRPSRRGTSTRSVGTSAMSSQNASSVIVGWPPAAATASAAFPTLGWSRR